MGIPQPAEMTGKSLAEGHDFGKDRKMLLIICDGWGLGSGDDGDAIHLADTPYWDSLLAEQSWSKLHASGEHVGLGSGKAGNSEAGHSNLGAGRCVMQDDVRLDAAVKDGSFKKNPIFLQAIEHAKKNGTALHLLAYLTYKSSHGCIDYPLAICEMARDAGLVLLNVPYAAVGGILALLITNFNFSISAGIGFIALFGICIQNGVIMISDIKNNLRERHPLEDSIKMSVKSRVRSVLMTASMAAIGLLPAALSHGIGSESQRPLAIVIIGGLIGATFFTLFVFPLMVEAFYRRMLYDKNGKLVQRRL